VEQHVLPAGLSNFRQITRRRDGLTSRPSPLSSLNLIFRKKLELTTTSRVQREATTILLF
jgi:hypothetical protein